MMAMLGDHCMPAWMGRGVGSLLLGAIALFFSDCAGPALAQETAPKDGLFVSVPNPITSEAVQQIKKKVQDVVDGPKRRNITTVVFDFNPAGATNSTSDFGPCSSLAKFIRQLQLGQIKATWPRLTTVAFVSSEVTLHSVLPVLACDQIILSGEQDKETRQYKARIG